MPAKPRIITINSQSKIQEEPNPLRGRRELSPIERDDLHQRIPMMINTLGIQDYDRTTSREKNRSQSREGARKDTQMRATMGNFNEPVEE